jgi:two-component system sensor histidine kinase AtoS
VTDNGSGIAQEQLNEIFNAFYSNKGQRGTGLGLAVTKQIGTVTG